MEMLALTLYYFHKEPETLDQLIKYWKYIEILTNLKILDTATLPLAFKK